MCKENVISEYVPQIEKCWKKGIINMYHAMCDVIGEWPFIF